MQLYSDCDYTSYSDGVPSHGDEDQGGCVLAHIQEGRTSDFFFRLLFESNRWPLFVIFMSTYLGFM